ncbi:hypothetical protein SO802_007945 [Lithocarpus litseifolius]|uniref:Uncharacterized protein n=1 Tax=Lithocarpus litseifolius TaxID=425828 RepID=A0AAW2DQG1_9ROSI
MAHQPVVADLKVGKIFKNWRGCGVYECEDGAIEKTDCSYFWHAIVIRGYSEEENGHKYFEIQNPWRRFDGDFSLVCERCIGEIPAKGTSEMFEGEGLRQKISLVLKERIITMKDFKEKRALELAQEEKERDPKEKARKEL